MDKWGHKFGLFWRMVQRMANVAHGVGWGEGGIE